MISARLAPAALVMIALAAGTLSDAPVSKPPVNVGGYLVLAADFHVHTFPLSGSTLAPWDLAIEARRQGLDALAITGHNHTLSGVVGEWFWRSFGGPIVLPGEEVHGPRFHLIAVGVRRTISWRLSAAEAIDEVHRQGGVAIAAHPIARSWPAWDEAGMERLDGAEVLQPVVHIGEDVARQLREFYSRRPLAAIGSSDYHGYGPVGQFRTLVFARSRTPEAILEALRARRTVVLGQGRVWGDPAFSPIAAKHPEWWNPPAVSSRARVLMLLSRVLGIAGLVGLVILIAAPREHYR